jgi:lipopolysaccharide/colanic/teichoic acid biosynthesis glycosyltransferase
VFSALQRSPYVVRPDDKRRAKPTPTAVEAGEHSPDMAGVLSQGLFRHALAREWKRAHRFEESFLLIQVSMAGRTQAKAWGQVIEVITASKHHADLLGWLAQDSVLGLLRPAVGLDTREAVSSMAKTAQELTLLLASEAKTCCSLQIDVCLPQATPPNPIVEGGVGPSSPVGTAVTRIAKRALDVAASSTLLAMLSPIYLATAVLVKATSKGPVFFRQERVGRRAQPFTMFKFRTMHVGVEDTIHREYVQKFIHSSSETKPVTPVVFKIVDDPRVTPIGHFLRRSSLDELPQFWNVLKGDMSLVGPRPPLPYEVAAYKTWHMRRVLEAKPGITGLWQVTGRSRTTFDDMVRLDLRYARSQSIWNDLKILLATPRAVFTGTGAH